MNMVFYRLPEEQWSFITEQLSEHQCFFIEDIDEIGEQLDMSKVDVLSVFVDIELTQKDIDKFPSLKLITARSTGYDYIDIKHARARGIDVSNVPSYGAHAVAEFAFALIFALSRRSYEAYHNLRLSGTIDISQYQGSTLHSKTIGIIGTGNIGRASISIAKGLGMKVCAYDAFPDQEYAQQLGFEYLSLDELLTSSDVVSIHVPLLPSTKHMIAKKELDLMKPEALLINTARGEIINTLDLVRALKEKRIAGAGLDVLEGERELKEEYSWLSQKQPDVNLFQNMLADHELIDMPNVIVTPHIAFNTKEAQDEIYRVTIENIIAHAQGKAINVVNNENYATTN